MISSRLRAVAVFFVAAAALWACRKEPTPRTPQSPDCSAEASVLATRQKTTTEGVNVAELDDEGLPPSYIRLGPDTLLHESGNMLTYHVFNRNGDYYLERVVAGDPVAGTLITETFFDYDSAHRILRRWRYQSTSVGALDSVIYEWREGNLVSEYDLISRQEFAHYEYSGDGLGHNPGNVPTQASQWLYRRGTTVQLSKDYVRRTPGRTFTPDLDRQGRLVRLESSDAPGYPLYFTYNCR